MLQGWLRREAARGLEWRENGPSVRNFKQAAGLATQLVVDMFPALKEDTLKAYVTQQIMILLSECIAQPSEVISRLGCSCLRLGFVLSHLLVFGA